MITGSKELIRDINSNLVLSMIINEGPISRAAISQKLGLTKATISTIVQALIDKDYVRELGSDNTSRGRKPILLKFQQNCGNVISIDLEVDSIRIMVSDLFGENCKLLQYQNYYDKESIVSYLIDYIREIIEQLPKTTYGVVGISLGIHGVVHDNRIMFAPYYSYEDIDFKSELEKVFHIPVFLNNEANLSVIGEKTFCYHYANIAGISVHSGVGLGVILDGKLFTGFNGNVGEIGHSIVEVAGRTCPCGNKGCLEQYVSEQALLKEFARLNGKKEAVIEDLIIDYQKGEENAVFIMDEFVKYMAVCVTNILNILNPDIIVINSSFTIHFPDVIKRITESLNKHIRKYCKLVPSGLQDVSILLGGVCVGIKNFLGIEYLELSSDLENLQHIQRD